MSISYPRELLKFFVRYESFGFAQGRLRAKAMNAGRSCFDPASLRLTRTACFGDLQHFSVLMGVVSALLASTAFSQAPAPATGQAAPGKPIRIVTSGVGSGFDIASRLIAQAMGSSGQTVVVDNRPAGVIPGQVVSKSPPDGYTLLYAGSSLWLGQFLQSTVPYDPIRDFHPIIHATRSPTLLVVHPSLPVKSLREFIALGRSKPGALNYATGSTGSVSHLTGELFQSMAGVKLVRVAYKSGANALTDLMAGEIQLMFSVTASATPHLKSGRLKALGVSSVQPTDLVPGVPTLAATGLPGFVAVSNVGAFVPAKTPRAVIERLNQEMARALASSEVKDRLFGIGVDAVGGTPEQFESAIKSEMASMGKVIRERGIREE